MFFVNSEIVDSEASSYLLTNSGSRIYIQSIFTELPWVYHKRYNFFFEEPLKSPPYTITFPFNGESKEQIVIPQTTINTLKYMLIGHKGSIKHQKICTLKLLLIE